MNYTYNIKVNLKNELINFYEWNKMDKITILKKVPVFKVNDNVYENIILSLSSDDNNDGISTNSI